MTATTWSCVSCVAEDAISAIQRAQTATNKVEQVMLQDISQFTRSYDWLLATLPLPSNRTSTPVSRPIIRKLK